MKHRTRKTILVIDEEAHVVRHLEALLQNRGYEIVSAAVGDDGMDCVASSKPDLICLDATQEKAGIRFYSELRDDPAFARIPVVVVTAVTGYGGDPAPFKRFLSVQTQFPPPEAFVAKPIQRDMFLKTISELLPA